MLSAADAAEVVAAHGQGPATSSTGSRQHRAGARFIARVQLDTVARPQRQPPTSGPLDWERIEFPRELGERARSVEFTCCALVTKGAVGAAFNVFTTAVLRSSESNRAWSYRAPKPVAITEELGLGILDGEVEATDGIAALRFVDELVLPRRDPPARVRAPGEWTVPRFWGRGDTQRPTWAPQCHEAFWTIERIVAAWPRDIELPEKALIRIASVLREQLGVDVPRERWGSVVVVVPEPRIWSTADAAQGPRISVEILPREIPAPERFIVSTRTRRFGALEYSRTHVVGLGRHVLPFPELFDEMDVEISDAASGHPLDRHVGSIIRGFDMSIDMSAGAATSVVADVVDPPVAVTLQFVDRQRSEIGGRAVWEERLAYEQQQRHVETLRQSGHVAFYAGGLGSDREGDRRRAVAAVRAIVRRAKTRLWIWDKYFGARDVLEFLTAVADRQTDVRVLTSTAIDVASLRDAVLWLRAPPGVPGGGLRSLSVMLGPRASSHDRFLVTDERCLLLGCSLNHLGSVCSSTLEFPDREAVERAFLDAWGDATPVGD